MIFQTMMNQIFGMKNFQNEIIWHYRTGGDSKKKWSKKHDTILFYSKTKKFIFNTQKEKAYTKSKSRKAGIINYGAGEAEFFEDEKGVYNIVIARDVWNISYINSQSKERTEYPTQKPLALLKRIIKASSNGEVFDV
jgi:site-specific DNA-methyltransferase (adenine-specific)